MITENKKNELIDRMHDAIVDNHNVCDTAKDCADVAISFIDEHCIKLNEIIELATNIIDDVNWYGGANLVNGEIQHFEKLIGRQECYKTNKTCRHNCNGLCKESC